jgi:hypothetical protein
VERRRAERESRKAEEEKKLLADKLSASPPNREFLMSSPADLANTSAGKLPSPQLSRSVNHGVGQASKASRCYRFEKSHS